MQYLRRLQLFVLIVWRPFDAIDGVLCRMSVAGAWRVSGMLYGQAK